MCGVRQRTVCQDVTWDLPVGMNSIFSVHTKCGDVGNRKESAFSIFLRAQLFVLTAIQYVFGHGNVQQIFYCYLQLWSDENTLLSPIPSSLTNLKSFGLEYHY